MLIEWHDPTFLLGLDVMDETHREFIQLLNELHASDDTAFPALFRALLEHTHSHFEREDRMMRDSRFPAYGEHHAEHLRILGELNQFSKRVERGSITFARSYINDSLPRWFQLHAATMDSALAAHLKQLEYKPGVFDTSTSQII